MANCRKYRRIGYLFRSGECTAEERAAWNEHVQGCPACQKLARQMAIISEGMQKTRAKVVEMEAPGQHTRKIMQVLAVKTPRYQSAPGMFFVFLHRPRIRFVQALLLIALIASFAWEKYLSASAWQENDLVHMLAIQKQTYIVSSGIPVLPSPRDRSSMLKIINWINWQYESAFTAKAGVLHLPVTGRKQLWQKRKTELNLLIQSCGWTPGEREYLLRQGVSYLHYYLSIKR